MAVDPNIKKKAEEIRRAQYGGEVQESLASGLESMSEHIVNNTGRQDYVEQQLQAVHDSTRGKDVISATEILASQVGADGTKYNNMKERLDAEQNKVNAQLAQKVTLISYYADRALMNGRIDSLTDGINETFETYAALVVRYPNGAVGNYVVSEDQNWYFWLDGSGWTSGGKWPASTIANESVTARTISLGAVGVEQTNFITRGTNLFDKDNVIYGSYATTNDGELIFRDNPEMNVVIIRAEASTQYYIDSTDFYHYMLNINDKEVAVGGHASNTLNDLVVTTTPTTAYLVVNVKNTNPRFENFVICKGNKKLTNLLPTTLDKKIKVDQSQIMDGSNRQLFNKNTVTEGQYDFKSNSIEGKFGDKVIHNIGFTTGAPGVKPFAFYNSKGQLVQNIEYGTDVQIPRVITFPENATRLVIQIFKSFTGFSFSKADLDKVMVFKGETLPSLYVPFGEDMNDYMFSQKFYDSVEKQLDLKNTPKIINVKTNGTGDFTRFSDALKYIDALRLTEPEKAVQINLYGPAVFNLGDEYTELEWKSNDFRGYVTRKNVNVKGVGDFGSIVVKADLPEGTEAAHVSRISTVHVTEGDFLWENILVVGGNVRYAGHDDDARTEGDVRFKRCKFLKLQNKGTYPNAFAGGWYNKKGDKFFVDCEFESEWDGLSKDEAAFSYHSRTNTSVPHLLHVENCSTKVNGQASGLRFGGMKGTTGINSTLKMIGNNINRLFLFEEGYGPVGVDLDVLGYANTDDLEVCVHVNEGQRKPEIKLTGNVKMTAYNQDWTN